jgi:hypothetical protein
MNGGELIGFFSTIGALIIAACAIIGGIWASVRRAEFRTRQLELEASLKQDMLNRGMSADEIERVLAAGQAKAEPGSCDEEASRRVAGRRCR